jgi:alkylation response protein AidB-like acyl-CoA dehydrogenase
MEKAYTLPAARQDWAVWQEALPKNLFTGDQQLIGALQRLAGPRLADYHSQLARVGGESAQLAPFVEELEREENLPQLSPCDAFGNPTQAVHFSPLWEKVGRVFWGSGCLSLLAQPGQELFAGSLLYLLDQMGEAGQACPVACTAGAIKLLQQVGSPGQKERYLPALLSDQWENRLHAAQFVTEAQGGSDVGANEVRAVPDPQHPGWFRLEGEKWFCSVADAGLFVVSARPPGAAPGTKGLALFLVPRFWEGKPNGFTLRRLKWKLGTRSLATGEVEFSGSVAEPISPLDRGFRHLVGIVLDTSRVHNTLAAAAFLRTAEVWASTYARHRKAFGQPIGRFPEVSRTLSLLRLRRVTALLTALRLLAMTDALATSPNEKLGAARRLSVMLAKYWTSRWATWGVRDAIEVLGGNGTIEDFSPLPRLYRDAIVLEAWEGSHNTLCAQVVRDMAVRGLGWPWLAQLEEELAAVEHPALSQLKGATQELLTRLRGRLQKVVALGEGAAGSWVRSIADVCCQATDLVVLLTQASWELSQGLESQLADLAALYWEVELQKGDPFEDETLAARLLRLGG